MSVYFRFEGDDGCKVDLVPEFIVTVWLHYIAMMTGKPDASMNSAQLVLKYLLMNANLVHNAWCVRVGSLVRVLPGIRLRNQCFQEESPLPVQLGYHLRHLHRRPGRVPARG